MKQGKELQDFLILTAIGEFYSEHSGLKTWDALCEAEPRILDEDAIWEPFEYDTPDRIFELVSDKIDFLEQFIKDVTA